jgi:hypothetical protein
MYDDGLEWHASSPLMHARQGNRCLLSRSCQPNHTPTSLIDGLLLVKHNAEMTRALHCTWSEKSQSESVTRSVTLADTCRVLWSFGVASTQTAPHTWPVSHTDSCTASIHTLTGRPPRRAVDQRHVCCLCKATALGCCRPWPGTGPRVQRTPQLRERRCTPAEQAHTAGGAAASRRAALQQPGVRA